MTGVVISSSLTVVAGVDGLNTDSPIIGYDQLVTSMNIAATTEDIDFPVANLANPATHLRWKSGAGSPSSDEYITVTLDTVESIDTVFCRYICWPVAHIAKTYICRAYSNKIWAQTQYC